MSNIYMSNPLSNKCGASTSYGQIRTGWGSADQPHRPCLDVRTIVAGGEGKIVVVDEVNVNIAVCEAGLVPYAGHASDLACGIVARSREWRRLADEYLSARSVTEGPAYHLRAATTKHPETIVHNRPAAVEENLQAAVLPYSAGVGVALNKSCQTLGLPCMRSDRCACVITQMF